MIRSTQNGLYHTLVVEVISHLYHPISTLIASVVGLRVGKMPSRKADQLKFASLDTGHGYEIYNSDAV